MDLLTFEIGKQEFAVEVELIESVIEKYEIRPVPKSKHYIEGLINLRGRICPVVDITKIVDIKLPDDHEYLNILILKLEEEEIGLYVDKVNNVVNVSPDHFETSLEGGTYGKKSKGVLKINDRLIVHLNIYELLSVEQE